MRMARRLLESVGVAMVLATVIVLLRLTTVAGQAPSTTVWGHPDLEGIWLDVYSTPLQRAPELGDREFATAEERAAQDQARMADPGRDRREGVGTAQDVSGAYNAVYTSVKPAGPRTSLVVDPPRCGRFWSLQRRLHLGEAGGSAHVARRRSAEREDSRVDRRSGTTRSSASGVKCSCGTPRPASKAHPAVRAGSTGPHRRADSTRRPSTTRSA